MTAAHDCPARGCPQRVPVHMLMCRPHWFMVPRAERQAVWAAWEGGSGTAWSNVPDQDLTVVVLTQRAPDQTGMPAVCDEVRTAIASR